ncbi:polyketide cyclase [Nocardioides seonyuensis]|uniref:Polyketide cyclase n=1 Tax=Nocardioides seonyuensis TaxID=2518371 RepID=A0A4P7IE19_9ACTN|nr:SRPBCC family protein [Nocardioides seonyuensis]QBX54217.1 polyketide cyclase [Nocardioides seonyuensis]
MEIRRTMTVSRPHDEVFAYLQDFTTTTEWDPGTVSTTLVSGDGGVGTRYHNVSKFLGRETELTYVVEEVQAPRTLRLRGENKTVVAHDTMTLMPTASGGTELTYHARFDFKGLARLVAPLMAPAFKRLGDEAEQRLLDVLGDAGR